MGIEFSQNINVSSRSKFKRENSIGDSALTMTRASKTGSEMSEQRETKKKCLFETTVVIALYPRRENCSGSTLN